jgi:DTW domain-containing protein YfiP
MRRPPLPPNFEPRERCARCGRPTSVCYCAAIRTFTTHTKVVILQHTRERDVPINTARIASLCLPEAELIVGVEFGPLECLDDPDFPPMLLYPGKDAVDLRQHPPSGARTLVLVDGTWAQARSLVRKNPKLASLPRYTFTPEAPSEYRIRREPKPEYVSTIEALAGVLGVLEGKPGAFADMLLPFRYMVDRQVEHASTLQAHRHPQRVRRARATARTFRTPHLMRERPQDLVCVTAEANAWPYGSPHVGAHELVQWCAYRPSSGETFQCILHPRRPLCPDTAPHMGVAEDVLRTGCSAAEFLARWDAFSRPGDIPVAWGPYALGLLSDLRRELRPAQLPWDPATTTWLDLRQVTRTRFQRKQNMAETVRALEDELGQRAPDHLQAVVRAACSGRAGERLAALSCAAALLTEPSAQPGSTAHGGDG